MESVGFALKDYLELVRVEPTEITLSGGVTHSETWYQLLADIWDVPVRLARRAILRVCLGAVMLIGVEIGAYLTLATAAGVSLYSCSEPASPGRPWQNPVATLVQPRGAGSLPDEVWGTERAYVVRGGGTFPGPTATGPICSTTS